MFFQQGVKLVGHKVVRLFPIISEGKVFGAPDAEMVFCRSQPLSAYKALPWHGQIQQFLYHAAKIGTENGMAVNRLNHLALFYDFLCVFTDFS
jgi:hypothetical protein